MKTYKYKEFEFVIEDGELNMTYPEYYEGQEIDNNIPTKKEVNKAVETAVKNDIAPEASKNTQKKVAKEIVKQASQPAVQAQMGPANAPAEYIAQKAKEDYDSVYAYPNPVKHDYQGLIAIKGLVRDCDVKITDVSGRLIYSTKALGGQAIWDGKNFEGSKAQTGVYVVYITNPDGSKTETTKIFFVN